MSNDAVRKWVEGYRKAWISNDPDEVRALFTEDAVYKFEPHDPEPLQGADAIVESWLEEPDTPGEHEFEWHELPDGLAVVQGVTTYDDGKRRVVYDNLFVIDLADDGRAREFTEWYMKRRDTNALKDWVTRYRAAWESNAPDDIRSLFTEDGVYHATPSHKGWTGHEEIVKRWLEHQDPAGSTTFEWKQVAFDGEIGVVTAVSGYPDGPKKGTYDNVWIVELAPDGRARSFTDHFVARPA
jgi:uncharacterized protein (TIGR02246 family)